MHLLKNIMENSLYTILLAILTVFLGGCSLFFQRERIELAMPITAPKIVASYVEQSKEVVFTMPSAKRILVTSSSHRRGMPTYNFIAHSKKIRMLNKINVRKSNIGEYPGLNEKEKIELNDIGIIHSIAELHGVDVKEVSSIYSIAMAECLPQAELSYIFRVAEISSVPMPKIIEVLKATIAQGIKLEQLVTAIKISEVYDIEIGRLVETIKESYMYCIPTSETVGVAYLSQVIGCKPRKVVQIYKELILEGVVNFVGPTIFFEQDATIIQTIDMHIDNISMEHGVTTARLRIEAMNLALAIFGRCKPIMPLSKTMPLFKSRWNIFSPEAYTELWEIKKKAEEMETRGENTDELWNLFWHKLMTEDE